MTLQKGTINYNDATVKANAMDAGEKGSKLKLIRSTLPLTLAVLGLLSLIAGFLLTRGGDTSRASLPADKGQLIDPDSR